MPVAQREQRGQGIDRSDGGRPDRRHDRAHAAPLQATLQRRHLEPATAIAWHGLEWQAEHGTDPLVRIVCLLGGDDCGAGMELPRHPQRLEVRHRAAAAQMTEVRFRSEEHTSELQSLAYLVCRLLLEKKKKPPYRAA